MDVSENGAAFKRRFCYMQDIPIRAFKFIRNASNINELESLGLENKLVTCKIPGRDIMNVVGAQGSKSRRYKQLRNRTFSIGAVFD